MRHNGRGRHTHSNQLEPHTKTSSATPAASQPIGTKAARSVHQGKQGATSAELPSTCENKQVHRRVGRGRDTHGKAIKTEPAGRSRKQDSGRQARTRETSREGEAIAEATQMRGATRCSAFWVLGLLQRLRQYTWRGCTHDMHCPALDRPETQCGSNSRGGGSGAFVEPHR